MKVLRWWPYALLTAALAGSIVVYLLIPMGLEGPRGFALNLATEIVGILLTVLLIDSVLRRREEQERQRYRSVALRQLWRPLNRQSEVLFNIYKAAAEREPEREISRISDLFDDDYFEQVTRLDGSADSNAVHFIGGPAIPWGEYIAQETKRFTSDLGRVVDKYATYLDLDTIDVAERLIDSDFISLAELSSMTVSHAKNGQYEGPVPVIGLQQVPDSPTGSLPAKSSIRKFTEDFSELVDIYNNDAPEDKKVSVTGLTWDDQDGPPLGSARISDGALGDPTGEKAPAPSDPAE